MVEILEMISANQSVIEFFLQAAPVGKAVILILLVGSIWGWILIIEGIVGIIRLRKALREWHDQQPAKLFRSIAEAGQASARQRIAGESVGEARQRITDAMTRKARAVVGAAEGGLSNLAMIASVAPFVGLFGTVWGIMSSFTAIAAAKDTSLAVVAPGIAEALATTAIGLGAAIPASIGYTRIGAAINACAQQLGTLIEERAVSTAHDGKNLREVA
jgi:biopolymer transport protein ExbB/TolQ